ncbi:MAG TPA: ABC transporter permease, partial [Flavisolibacter sp.]|nr:ABC transporter permease [Flavisolibacter sp.]
MDASASFWQASWRRLKKNKGAMAGLVMICVAVFIAVFGYFLSPDPSPFANRIILEIGGEKPGYKKDFLLVKKVQAKTTGFFDRLVSGK